MAGSFSYGGSGIPSYSQTRVFQTSGKIGVPSNTKRIEALLCGGGCINGFGGLQIYEIPVVGSELVYVVGAGTNTATGGESSVSVNGVKYAAVGGHFGCANVVGKPPYNVSLLRWSALDSAPATSGSTYVGGYWGYYPTGTTEINISVRQPGSNAGWSNNGGDGGTNAVCGWGGSTGMGATAQPGMGAAQGGAGGSGATGGYGGQDTNQNSNGGPGGAGGAGGGGGFGGLAASGASASGYTGGAGGAGGSMTWCSVWGLAGFAGGTGGTGSVGVNNTYAGQPGGGGGGGGMLAVGSNGGNAATSTPGAGGNGGNGGGGAGTGYSTQGTGGNGFVMFRFYF